MRKVKGKFVENFEVTEKIEVRVRQDLADRLPKEKSERNAFINRAVEHELDGRKAAASLMGKASTPKKTAAAKENAKKPRPRKKKLDKNKARGKMA